MRSLVVSRVTRFVFYSQFILVLSFCEFCLSRVYRIVVSSSNDCDASETKNTMEDGNGVKRIALPAEIPRENQFTFRVCRENM